MVSVKQFAETHDLWIILNTNFQITSFFNFSLIAFITDKK